MRKGTAGTSDVEFALLCQQFEQVFGEAAPTFELPDDQDQAADLLRQAIHAGDVSIPGRAIPPNATS